MDGTFTIARDLNLVTVYAAFVSTLVLVWQIFTYLRDGARLRARAAVNMKTFGVRGSSDDDTYIVLTVVNVGNADTTVTHVIVLSYNNWWRRIRRRPNKTFIITNTMTGQAVPYVLEVGRQFMTMATQTVEFEQLSRETLLYIGVHHAFGRNEVLARIRPIALERAPATQHS